MCQCDVNPLPTLRCCRYCGGDIRNQAVNVVVRLRKKRAPPVANHLIIPIVRVARNALSEKAVMECAANKIGDMMYKSMDKNVDSSGALISCCFAMAVTCWLL